MLVLDSGVDGVAIVVAVRVVGVSVILVDAVAKAFAEGSKLLEACALASKALLELFVQAWLLVLVLVLILTGGTYTGAGNCWYRG